MEQSYFTRHAYFTDPKGIYFVEKRSPFFWNDDLFLCKDYKKDIFGRFAYDFELSQNILSFLI